MNSDFAILILSCDKYSDAWDPFFALFRKFWPDCPYKVYLATNELKPEVSGVHIIASGKPKNWSDDTLAVLKQIQEGHLGRWLWVQKCCQPLVCVHHVTHQEIVRLRIVDHGASNV